MNLKLRHGKALYRKAWQDTATVSRRSIERAPKYVWRFSEKLRKAVSLVRGN